MNSPGGRRRVSPPRSGVSAAVAHDKSLPCRPARFLRESRNDQGATVRLERPLLPEAFERFTRCFAFGCKSLAQETVDAGSMIESGFGGAFGRMFDCVINNRIIWRDCFGHQAAAANAQHKYRISSSTSRGSSTV